MNKQNLYPCLPERSGGVVIVCNKKRFLLEKRISYIKGLVIITNVASLRPNRAQPNKNGAMFTNWKTSDFF